jgi:FkbM family methyltransferase
MYNSQQKEDEYLHKKFLNYKNGFFIELGGMDGIKFSNTLFFENVLGWSGVLIEPTEQYHQMVINRPKCHNFKYAVSEIEGEVIFVGDDALGGIYESMSNQHYIGWGLDKKQKYSVESKPINKILKDINIERVDFFSIDVEGGEYEVLSTFDWSIPVYVVLIELSFEEEKNIKNRDFLISKGFIFDNNIGCNEVWINLNNKKNEN